ncbi:hypothetical protein CROQUDRAFT_665011, partial [Cronartium quercuum f. sp. fusiforme G11]
WPIVATSILSSLLHYTTHHTPNSIDSTINLPSLAQSPSFHWTTFRSLIRSSKDL